MAGQLCRWKPEQWLQDAFPGKNNWQLSHHLLLLPRAPVPPGRSEPAAPCGCQGCLRPHSSPSSRAAAKVMLIGMEAFNVFWRVAAL